MIRPLSFALVVLLLGGIVYPSYLLAQTDSKSKSRLLIQKSPQKADLPILLSKRVFRVDLAWHANLDLKQNFYLSQWMKSNYAKTSSTSTSNAVIERRIVEENTNTDKYLFFNDRIQVTHVYPNPATDFVDIDYQFSGNQDLRIVFYNVIGEQIKELPLERDQRTVRVSMRDFANGMYLYQLFIDGRSVATKKLIVRKGV